MSMKVKEWVLQTTICQTDKQTEWHLGLLLEPKILHWRNDISYIGSLYHGDNENFHYYIGDINNYCETFEKGFYSNKHCEKSCELFRFPVQWSFQVHSFSCLMIITVHSFFCVKVGHCTFLLLFHSLTLYTPASVFIVFTFTILTI